MKKIITCAAVVLGLALAGNASAETSAIDALNKVNSGLESAQNKIKSQKEKLKADQEAREKLLRKKRTLLLLKKKL